MDPRLHRLSRRMMLAELGKGTLAVAIFGVGVVACSSDGGGETSGATPSSDGSTSSSGDAVATTSTPDAPALEPVTYQRVDLGFVSAYVLVRGNEAAIVDTGVEGSAPQIGDALTATSLGFDAVEHVILTHWHGDHVGSIGAVLEATPGAIAYAGAEDIALIESPQELRAVGDGDEVFGLQVISTPGHTPGHISIYDPVGELLVAGDAINNADGLVGSPPQFTDDQVAADESVRKLAQLEFDELVVGHGDPIETGAGAAVRDLAATL